MFSVCVVGGAALANSTFASDEDLCQVELTKNKKLLNGQLISKTICLDEQNQNESVLEIVKSIVLEEEQPDCISPFCGCWLG